MIGLIENVKAEGNKYPTLQAVLMPTNVSSFFVIVRGGLDRDVVLMSRAI